MQFVSSISVSSQRKRNLKFFTAGIVTLFILLRVILVVTIHFLSPVSYFRPGRPYNDAVKSAKCYTECNYGRDEGKQSLAATFMMKVANIYPVFLHLLLLIFFITAQWIIQ